MLYSPNALLHTAFSPILPAGTGSTFVYLILRYLFFSLIGKEGVKANFMRPVFPSLTFVNHYTMATVCFFLQSKVGLFYSKRVKGFYRALKLFLKLLKLFKTSFEPTGFL